MCFGVILDTVSIQKYIFSTNNLKENLGASFIVAEKIYTTYLEEAIKEVFGEVNKSLLQDWKTEPEKIAIKNGAPYEVGYEGGGNAFLLFADENRARAFIEKWSKMLLVYCPGLVASAAAGRIELNGNFSRSLKSLFETLSKNKAEFVAQTVIPRHGITADCARTGYSREVWCDNLPASDRDYISSVASAKISAVEDATEKYREILKDVVKKHDPEHYDFTNELEKLGQIKHEESHIAIVYIDGNDMTTRFRNQSGLPDLRKLSSSVKQATLESFKRMLKIVIEKIPKMNKEFNLQKKDKKTILPLRPIIIGGDDITFVSEGRLGVWLAKVFLEEFEQQQVSDGLPLTACASVSITKTKYPFYRGYSLSEQLLKNAKDIRKHENDSGSWIDFHISYGGFSGSLKQIREKHYRTSYCKKLILRPYKLSDLDELLRGVSELKKKDERGKSMYPRTKIMQLREALYSGPHTQELLERDLQARELKLPAYKKFDGKTIVRDAETPYLDMIELMEFYPDFELNGGEQ